MQRECRICKAPRVWVAYIQGPDDFAIRPSDIQAPTGGLYSSEELVVVDGDRGSVTVPRPGHDIPDDGDIACRVQGFESGDSPGQREKYYQTQNEKRS